MIERCAALAVFVKTPGLSPIKTRLAEGIGRERAEEFFDLSLAAVEATAATIAESSDVCPYWAVAEESGLENPRWQQFSRIHQGTGNLGERLGQVFSDLQCRHEVVVSIGADSPQITPETIQRAFRYLQQGNHHTAHVIGRCHDGGFYLVGTNQHLALDTWQDVPYSTSAAADRLAAILAGQAPVYEVGTLSDVDQVADLAVLAKELNVVANLSPAQLAVLKWVAAIESDIRHDTSSC